MGAVEEHLHERAGQRMSPKTPLHEKIAFGLTMLVMVAWQWFAPKAPVDPTEPQKAEFFTLLALFAVFLVLSTILKPKPKIENAKPAGLGDFKFPTAMEGRPVPIIWGTVKQEGPNVVWYGDLRSKAITEKVKTGLFSSKRITVGYKYFIGIQFALCRGGTTPVGELRRIWVGDTELWSGSVTSDNAAIDINQPNFLGGNDLGQGGIVGTLRFYRGSTTQTASTYLSTHQQVGGQTPAYRGTCYAVWEQGYIGDSTSIKPWAFELRRIPNPLGLGGSGAVNSGNDANPMNVIYEILTNTEWGLGQPTSDIDTSDFAAAGATLATEGNGFSFLLDNKIEAQELLRLVEQQIDGIVYLDRTTGKWRVNLARGGYTLSTKRALNASNVLEISQFSRGAWADTANSVLVKFDNRALDYKETYASAQDMANVKIQGNKVVSVEVTYPGVKNGALANTLAWRYLRTLAIPMARAELVVNRDLWDHNPGDVVRWTDPDLGFTDLPMRITKIDLGKLDEGRITVTLVQDIFVFDTGVFAAPGSTNWTPPPQNVTAIPTGDSLVFEAPRKFVTLSDQPGVLDRIWCGARYQGDSAVDMDIVSRPGSGSYTNAGDIADFTVAGKLLSGITASGTQGSISLTIVPDPDSLTFLQELLNATYTAEDIGQRLSGLILIDNEFFAFRNLAPSGGNLSCTNGYRGLLDTVPAAHATDARVWVLFGNLTDRAFTPGGNVDIKLLPRSPTQSLPEASASAISRTMNNRGRRPYPPVRLTVNASVYPASAQSLDNLFGSGLDGRGLAVGYLRRDFRNSDEAAAVANETVPSDFPSAHTTQYAIEVRNDPSGTNTLLFTTPWNGGTASINLSRTRILRFTAGVLPTRLRTLVKTRHTLDGVTREALQTLDWDFDVNSTLLSGDFNFGVLAQNIDSADFTAPSTGTYTVNIGTALASGTVQYRLNGGSWTNVVTAGNTTGTFSATATDIIEVRHTQAGSTDSETFLELVFGGTSIAYAVLTY